MPIKILSLRKRILIWRIQHVNNKHFLLILSVLLGIASGLVALAMRSFTHFIEELLERKLVQEITYGFYFIFPTLGFIIVYIVKKYVIRNDVKHGIPSILYAVAHQKGVMKPFWAYACILVAPITIGFGGSVGLEGPMVVTGAGISSILSRMFHVNQSDRILLLACACTGALAAIFKVPLAAILFAIEVFGLDLTLSSLIPLFLSSLSGVMMAYFFFGNEVLIPITITEQFALNKLPFYIALGLVGGLMSAYFMFVNEKIGTFFKPFSPWQRVLIGGALLGVLIFLMPPLYGEGHQIINHLKEGHPELSLKNNIFGFDLASPWTIIFMLLGITFMKVFATSITFGAGGVGGIFSPMLFMGAVMGNCFARIVNELPLGMQISLPNFTLLGMTALMAGVLHAPLTALFLIAEVTGGYTLFVPAMLTAAVAFLVAKSFNSFSIYTQELGKKGELISQNKDQSILTLLNLHELVETNFSPIYTDMTLGEMIQDAVKVSSRNIYPVLNRQNQHLKGIVFLDDIRHLMFEPKYYQSISVLELMHTPPAIIDLDSDKAHSAMAKFQQTSAWNLPVVHQGQYCGFISKSKLLSVYRRKLIYFTQ